MDSQSSKKISLMPLELLKNQSLPGESDLPRVSSEVGILEEANQEAKGAFPSGGEASLLAVAVASEPR
jgi:hypothetical protein